MGNLGITHKGCMTFFGSPCLGQWLDVGGWNHLNPSHMAGIWQLVVGADCQLEPLLEHCIDSPGGSELSYNMTITSMLSWWRAQPKMGTTLSPPPRLREHHRKGDRKNVRAFWIWHHHWTDCSSGYLYKIKPTGKPIHIRQLLLDTVGFNNNNNTSKREDMEIEVGHFIHTHTQRHIYIIVVYTYVCMHININIPIYLHIYYNI